LDIHLDEIQPINLIRFTEIIKLDERNLLTLPGCDDPRGSGVPSLMREATHARLIRQSYTMCPDLL